MFGLPVIGINVTEDLFGQKDIGGDRQGKISTEGSGLSASANVFMYF